MKRTFYGFILLATVAITGIISCNEKTGDDKDKVTTTNTPGFDLAAVRSAIEKSNSEMESELLKGDSTAMAAHYTSDAKLLVDAMPAVSGADGIRGMWGYMTSNGLRLKFNVVDVWGNNDMVAEEGTYLLSDKTGKEMQKGKYIVLWKQEGGKWKMFRDIWNGDSAMPPPPPPTK